MFIVNNFASDEIQDQLRRIYSTFDQPVEGGISKEYFIKCKDEIKF